MRRSGKAFQIDWPNWQIIILLLIGVSVLTTADAAGLMGTPPIAIEVRAEPIKAFDLHDPSRLRFGQLEFRGGLHPESHPTGNSAVFRLFGLRPMARSSSHSVTMDGGLGGASSMKAAWPVAIADPVMAPILGPYRLALAAPGWHDTESIADDGGTLYVGIETVNQIVRFDYGRDGLLRAWASNSGAARHPDLAAE